MTNNIESKVIVEAGHIYTNELPAEEHEIGAKIGSEICKALKDLGFVVEKWLFIDDYNPQFENKPILLDESKYESQLASLGFVPDVKVYESALVEQAEQALQSLVQNNYAQKDYKSQKVALCKHNILLFDPETKKYSCSLLDACLYMKKAQKGNVSITVLDQQFEPQQKGTLTVLKKLGGKNDSIFPVYHSTPSPVIHESVAHNNVFLSDESGLALISDALSMLKLFGKTALTGSSLDKEVLKYLAK